MSTSPSHVQRHQPSENMRQLVATMRMRMMEPNTICDLLDCRIGTARKYLAQLADAGCIVLDHFTEKPPRAARGRPVYRLVDDEDLLQKFMLMVEANEVPPPSPRRPVPDPVKTGRRFHILGDDQAINFNTNMRQVMRDPLVAAFFGEARPCAS